MANAAVNDIILCTIEGQCFSQQIVLTHTLYLSTVTGAVDILAAQSAIATALAAGGTADILTDYAACLSTSYTSQKVTAQRVSGERMRRSEVVSVVNGNVGQSEVTNLACGLTFITQRSGRDQQATKHIGPLGQGTADVFINNGKLTADYLELFENLGTAMLGSVNVLAGACVATPCIVHRNPETGEIVGFTEYDNFKTSGVVSSQRTRIIGKGV